MTRVRLKLFGVLALSVVVAVAVSGLLADRWMRQQSLETVETMLLRNAQLVGAWSADIPFQASRRDALDALADRAGESSGLRFTLLSREGEVLGDSEVPTGSLRDVENHAQRPEIASALAGAVGVAERRSDTLKRTLFYLAAPSQSPDGGVVRVAIERSRVEEFISTLRRRVLGAALLGSALALLAGWWLLGLRIRPFATLGGVLARLSELDLDARLPPAVSDELGDIAASTHRLGETLRLHEAAAMTENEQLAAVFSSMVEGVLVVDRNCDVVLANPRLREMMAIHGDPIGRPAFEVLRSAEISDALRDALQSDELAARELERVGPDGRTLLVHTVGFPAEGRREGAVAVLHDVTELHRVDQVRRDFVANASHELRTPLTAIRGFAETMLGDPSHDESLRKPLEVIARHSTRMGLLIDDLLELSRIESGTHRLLLEDVDLRSLVTDMLAGLAPRFEEKELLHGLDDASTAPACRARGDKRALEHVLTNLLDNAIKYTDPGGEIRVSVEPLERHVRVSIRDNGQGISSADRARIFERFYRVDAARSRALGGTGLGLSIVKHLIATMSGEITVESELGRGSNFSFTLPRAAG